MRLRFIKMGKKLFKSFEKNFNSFIIGFVSGLVIYLLTISKQGVFNTAFIIFFSGLLLISIYTLGANKTNKFDNKFFKLLGKITEAEFLFYLIIIPSILVLIYLLPNWISDIFKLNLNQPNFISLFFSNYTHQNLGHLLGNLGAYFLLIILILNLEPNKKEFHWFSIFAFLVFPFVIYPITKLSFNLFGIINFPSTLGFSGIVALFNGYFIYCLYKYLKTKAFKNLKLSFVFFLLIFNITIWGFFNNFYLGLASLILIGLLTFMNLTAIKPLIIFLNSKLFLSNGRNKINWKNFVIFMLILIPLVSLITLVPKELISNGSIINTPVHFFSLLIGVFLPYLYEIIKFNKKEKDK